MTQATIPTDRAELVKVETALVEFDKVEAGLEELRAKYKGTVYDVLTPAGMKAAIAARADCRTPRVAVEKVRKDAKAPVLALGRTIDSRAAYITAELSALEDPIDAQIKSEEKRKEDERLAAARAEQERLTKIEDDRKAEEERKLAEQRAELAKQQAALDKAKAEQEERDRAARAKIEEEERAARLRIEQQERVARLQREEADRVARKAREEEERKAAEAMRAERERLDASRREEEDRQRAARAEAEAAARREREAEQVRLEAEAAEKRRLADEAAARQREIARKAAEQADAAEMLQTFKARFGHMAQYAKVVKAIDAALVAEVA